MFEREIKFIYDFNINKLNSLGSFFSFQQLRESDIHPAIIQYMSAELDYLIFEDRQRLVKDSIFDYSNDKVTKHFSAIGEELKKSKRLSSDYAAKLILHAISFNINYLVRPKWALVKFIFEDESHRSAADIKQLLNYLHFYKYLKKILISYLNNKKIISMNSAEFVELLNKIDELTIQTSFNDMISSSLKSMGEFFNIGGVQKSKIPYSAIQIFLDEKGLENHLRKLNDVFSDDANSRIELNDVLKLLTSIMAEKIEVSSDPEKGEEVIEEEILLSDSSHKKEIVEEPEFLKHREYEAETPEAESSEAEALEAEVLNAVVPEAESPEADAFEAEILEAMAPEAESPEAEAPEAAIPDEELQDQFEMEEPVKKDSVFEIPLDDEEDIVENVFMKNSRDDEAPVIEEEKETEPAKIEFEDEIIIEHGKESDDEWVFVEEEEHTDLIKEITRPSESEIKKNKPGKKKTSSDDEDLLLFDENEDEEKMFKDVLQDEEKAYKETIDISGSYEETHKDFTKLLENKNMSNIIDVLFDNDIEEVELMLNSISYFATYPEAEKFIDTYFAKMGVKPDSVESVTFKKIIRDNYNTGRQ